MLVAVLLWSLAVAAVWWLADVILDILTPSAAWLEANAAWATWISPLLGVVGTLGVSAAVVIWLIGVVLILVVGRLRPLGRVREAMGRGRWRDDDERFYRPERSYRRDWEDDGDRRRDRRRWKRRRRDDDDDDDDD